MLIPEVAVARARARPVFLILVLLGASAFAGEDTLPIKFQRLNVDKGLPDHTVNHVLQDQLGFIWMATTNGICRYDGRRYLSFRHDIHKPDSLTNNLVNRLYQDRSGTIWVCTSLGLNALKDDFSGFRHFLHDDKQPDSLAGDLVNLVYEDSRERLWVGTGAGLSLMTDRSTGRFENDPLSKEADTEVFCWFLLEDGRNRLWLGTDHGLMRYDENTRTWDAYPVAFPDGQEVTGAYSGFLDETGLLWLGTNLGLAALDTQTDQLDVYQTVRGDDTTAPSDTISIAADTSGTLWLGNYYRGVTLFDRRARRFQAYKRVFGDPTSLPADTVRSVLRDASGLMWVGTSGGGAALWNPLTRAFLQYTRIAGEPKSLNSEVPWAFAELADGTVWIATDAGLNRWRYGSSEFESVVHDPEDPDSIGPGAVYVMASDDTGKLWLTTDGRLNRFDPSTRKARQFVHADDNPTSIPAGGVYGMLPVGDTRIWLGMTGGGLVLFDADQGLMEQYLPDDTKENWITTDLVGQPIASRDGHLWVGSMDGLFHFDQEKKHFTHYPEKLDGTGLSSRFIFRIYEDEAGHVWIATNGGGLNRLWPDGHVDYYTTREGLPDDGILSVVKDRGGYIWMSTVRGLSRLDPESGAVRNFNLSHGLQSNEFNEGSSFIDRGGRIYMGGGNGFNVFDPDEIGESRFMPPVHFTAVTRYADKELSPFMAAHTHELNLSWNVAVFSVAFNALDYAVPSANNYQYLLEGFSREWIKLGNRNEETFTNIKPGDYRLRVRGSNSAGLWSEHEAVMAIHIAVPPWRRPASLLLYLIAAVLFFGLLWRNQRVRQAARQRAHLALLRSEERLKHALWGTGDELWDWNLKTGKVVRSNMLSVRKHSNDNMQLDDIYNEIHPDDVALVKEALGTHLAGESNYYEACYRLMGKDGHWVWVMDRGRIVERDADGRPLRVAGTNKNITGMKQTEEDLKLIAKAFENTSDGVVITDTDFLILATNPAYTRITGFLADQVVGSSFMVLGEAESDTRQGEVVRGALEATGHWTGELWKVHKKGGRFPVTANMDVVRGTHGQITHYVCVFTDITMMKAAEEKMQNLANYDQLTSLPNRNLFQDRLTHALSLAGREKHKVALLFLDLDRFKNINDSLGHAAGDQLLQAVADRVRRGLREVDSVARLGGDEFTVILEGINQPDRIAAVAEKILQGLDRAFVLQGRRIVVTPSIGISVFPDDGQDAEALLKCADTAMYHAKKMGGNTYQFFKSEMNRAVVEKLSLENDMRRGLEQEEFVVYYQPKWDTRAEAIAGFEALVRWQHPSEGMVSPARFIPVAEETGLIVPLGLWVLQRACTDAAAWLDAGLPGSKVAVNLSALQFRQVDLVDRVAQILQTTGLPAERLELEITESTLLNNIDHAIDVLLQFRNLGLTLALDDFGTGFSSLGYLKRLPIQTLKIDRSFVKDISEDPETASIVSTIITLAHNLRISVVAEGVETVEQLRFLVDRDCGMVQGYYFSPPVPLEEATAMLTGLAAE